MLIFLNYNIITVTENKYFSLLSPLFFSKKQTKKVPLSKLEGGTFLSSPPL